MPQLGQQRCQHVGRLRPVLGKRTVLNVLGIGVALENADKARHTPLHVQVEPELDERGHGSLRQRVARSDVDLVDLRRQTVDDHGQQRLVAQHNGRPPSVAVALLFAQPVAGVACLDVLGGRGDVAHGLVPPEVPVDFVALRVQLVGECLQVAPDVLAGLVVCHVVMVEIPVEMRLALLLQGGEQLLLHLLQQVEAHKEIVVIGKRYGSSPVCGHALAGDATDYLTVKCSFVGETLRRQPFVEIVVNVGEMAPKPQETLFELGIVVFREIAEEALYYLALLVGEVGDVVELVDVAQVGKHAVGVGHVLVDVIEIAEQQLPPAVELVQRLGRAGLKTERLVEIADLLDGVGYLKRGLLAEQFADGDIRGAPQGLACLTGQVLVEKQRGTLVGKYNGHARQIGAVLVDDILGDVC